MPLPLPAVSVIPAVGVPALVSAPSHTYSRAVPGFVGVTTTTLSPATPTAAHHSRSPIYPPGFAPLIWVQVGDPVLVMVLTTPPFTLTGRTRMSPATQYGR